MARFVDRSQAGRELAVALQQYKGADAVVYALPRGGVVTGIEVAQNLGLPFDLVIARKIGAPENPEYAIAAIAEDGDLIADEHEVSRVDEAWFKKACAQQQREARRRREVYVGSRLTPSVQGKTAIVVDDGIATGLTMRAVIQEIRHKQPKQIVVAVPVSSSSAEKLIKKDVDTFISLEPLIRGAIGASYDEFSQVSDERVRELMRDFDAQTKK